jgi:AcrR family transcriptional regulator
MGPRRRRSSLAAAVLAGWTLLGISAPGIVGVRAQDGLSNTQVLANLLDVVFGSEFIGEDSAVVRKWSGPMRLAIYARDPAGYRHLVLPHLDHLRRITGLDIRLVDGSDPDQNAYVFVFGREQFYAYAEQHLGPGKNPRTNRFLACFGYFHANGRKDIDEITAVIPSFISDEEIRTCVVEEVTQALGLPNDSDSANPSIFNDDDAYQDLTWQDELFLRVLYDPRVRSGMTRAEFEPLAGRILEELRPGS